MNQSSRQQQNLPLEQFVDEVNQRQRERYGANQTRPSPMAMVKPYWEAGYTPTDAVHAIEEEFVDEARAESRMS